MVIAGMVKSSFVDYPGLVACVLFVPGCNYNCYYCHNRSLIDGTHDTISSEFVDAFLRRRAGLLDGVVISGGEPTLQKDLIAFTEKIGALGYRLKLDTNGSSPAVVSQLLQAGLFHYYALDYKAPAERYREICRGGADASAVRRTADLLLCAGIPFEVRTTVIPQLSETDLIHMAKELPVLPRYVLNRYRKPERYLSCDEAAVEQTPYTHQQIKSFADLVRPWQPNVTV